MPDDQLQILRWSFNPWKQGLGGWRRPQLALPLSLMLAVILSWSLTVPNFPQGYEAQLEGALAELGNAPFAVLDGRQLSREQVEGQLAQVRTARESFPVQWLLWGLVSAVLLLGMNASLYLPVRYELNEQGVRVEFMGMPSLRRWEHYRNFYPHEHLVHLTTLPRPSALDPFRGHSLMFSGNRDSVLAYIGKHVERRDSKGPGTRDQGPASGQ